MKLTPEGKIGLLTFAALLLVAILLMWKGDILLKSHGYRLTGIFENVGGLQEGAEVRYRGFKVGKVNKVLPDPTTTRVNFIIDSSVKIPADSALRIAFDGLIGQKYIELMPGESKEFVKSGSTLQGFSTLGMVDFLHVGTKNLEESKKILEDVQRLTGDPTVQKDAKHIIRNLQASTNEITQLVNQLRNIIEKGNVDKLLTNFGDVVEKLDTVTEQIGSVTSDPKFPADMKKLIHTTQDTLEEIQGAAADLRRLVKRYNR